MDIFLVRHGESLNNTLPEDQHQPDPPLTERGRLQVAQLAQADLWARWRPQRIISSPLRRAMDTAAPLVERLGVPWVVWADLAEAHRSHPDDGHSLLELAAAFPRAAFEPGIHWPGHPGDEDPAAAGARARRVAARLAGLRGLERLALVGHAGFGQYLMRAWLWAPQDGSVQLAHDNTAVHHVRLREGRALLLRFNDCAHLGTPLGTAAAGV